MRMFTRSREARRLRSRQKLSTTLRNSQSHWSLSELEPRLLLAGDAGTAVVAASTGDTVVSEISAANTDANTSAVTRQIVFLDSRVPDIDFLASQVDSTADLVLIGAGDNAMGVIARTVESSTSVSSIHIISHGADGMLQLGDQRIDAATLKANANQIAAWSEKLTADADVLLYGCDVVASDVGQQFIRTLAQMTGADVAASSDTTGAFENRANWILEESIGTIESSLVLSTIGQNQYRGTLNIVINAWGQTGEEQFQLQIDGQTVATYDAATTWTPFEYETSENLTGDQVRIRFINDAYDPANNRDRNLFVNNIQINGANYETDSAETFSSGSWTPQDGIVPGYGRGIVLHTNGFFQYGPLDDPGEPQTTIVVRARGDEGSEEMQILDGDEVLLTTSVTTTYEDYGFTINREIGSADLRVQFINDLYDPDNGVDRNLDVDYVRINSQQLESESPTTFATGVYVDGQGIQSGFFETETLSGNGYLQYDAPAVSTGIIDVNYGDNGGLVDSGRFQAESSADEFGNTFVLSANELRLFDSNGLPITAFGGDGLVNLNELFPNVTFSQRSSLSDVVSTGDGGWLVSTVLSDSNSQDNVVPSLIFKVNFQGELDTAFGNQGVVDNANLELRLRNFGGLRTPNVFSDAIALDVDSQGRIVLAGGVVGGNDRLVVRLQSDGSLDSSFGNNGTAVLSRSNDTFFAQQRNVKVLDDGGILSVFRDGNDNTVAANDSVFKLTSSGALDTSYGDNGIASFGFAGIQTAIDSLGRVLFASDIAVTRVDANGNLDSAFGTDGVFSTVESFDVGLGREGVYSRFGGELTAIAVDDLDRVVVAIAQRTQTGPASFIDYGTMYLLLNSAGQLDSTFSDDGASGVNVFPTSALVFDQVGFNAVGIELNNGQFGRGVQYRLLT